MLKRTLCAFLMLLAAPTAFAGGFEYNDNGASILTRSGAFTAKANHPLAMYYNPAGLMLMSGHRLYLGSNFNFMISRFTRTGIDGLLKTDANPDGLYDSATVSNESPFFAAPSAAWTYSAPKWAFGLGVFGPGAQGSRRFPSTGPQRFELTEAEVYLAYLTLSGAVRASKNLSFGLSLQYVVLPMARFKLVIDGNLLATTSQTENSALLAEAEIDMSDWAGFSAIVGMHWRPLPSLEIGLSSRVTPIVIQATGAVNLAFPDPSMAAPVEKGELGLVSKSCASVKDPCPASNAGTLKLTLPPWVRLGIRYVSRDAKGDEVWDLELDFAIEFWSMLQAYDVTIDAKLRVVFMNLLEEVPDFSLQKQYRDVFSVRLGSDIRLIPNRMLLHLGLHYESPATRKGYTMLDFMNFHRLGASAGLTLKFKSVNVTFGYQLVWQPTWTEDDPKLPMVRPMSEAPDPIFINAGVYNATYHTASLGLVFKFK